MKVDILLSLDEVYTNPYNTEWVRAWDGNIDIKVILDYFAVIIMRRTTMPNMTMEQILERKDINNCEYLP